jgi:SAM-dependent methyltransferase
VGRAERSDAARWDEWYGRAGRKALASRAPQDEQGYFASGAQQVDAILEMIGRPRGTCVLEIGCGDGRMTRALALRFARVLALDASPVVLEACRQNLAGAGNVEFVLGGPGDLGPLPGRSLDCVVSATVFQHITDPAAIHGYVAQTVRLLAPTGGAALQFRNPSFTTKLRDAAVDVARVPSRLPGVGDRWRGCTVTYDDVKALVEGRVGQVEWRPAGQHAWLLLSNDGNLGRDRIDGDPPVG